MITQIYSIQTAEEALACIGAGADRIGLLVGVHGGKFPCAITQEKAKEIFEAMFCIYAPISREARNLLSGSAERSPASS